MDEIFKQYGSTIIVVLAIIALIGIIALVIGSGNSSIVYKELNGLVTGFYDKASDAAGLTL